MVPCMMMMMTLNEQASESSSGLSCLVVQITGRRLGTKLRVCSLTMIINKPKWCSLQHRERWGLGEGQARQTLNVLFLGTECFTELSKEWKGDTGAQVLTPMLKQLATQGQ